MSEPIQDTRLLKDYAKKINDTVFNNVEIIKFYKRYVYSLSSLTGKIEGGEASILDIFQKAFGNGVKIEKISGDVASKVSGTYDAFLITLPNQESLYFRSIVTSRGSLANKDLTPNKLGLDGKTFTLLELDIAVKDGLAKQTELPANVLNLAYQLLNSVKPTLSLDVDRQFMACINEVSSSDVKIIGKNFGEVLVAKWCLLTKPDAISVNFPRSEANPLADFSVNFRNKPPLNISSKFEAGARASVKSFLNKNTPIPAGATTEEKTALAALLQVTDGDSIVSGLLEAERLLQTREYKGIQQLTGKTTPTLADISDLVKRTLKELNITKNSVITPDQVKEFRFKLWDFYSDIAGGAPRDADSLMKIEALPDNQKYHPITYAFSVALAMKFNTENIYHKILNEVAQSIKAEQIYAEFKQSGIEFKIKKFSESKFSFKAGAFTHKSDNVRMKVDMK
jgi:hypothetical protein